LDLKIVLLVWELLMFLFYLFIIYTNANSDLYKQLITIEQEPKCCAPNLCNYSIPPNG